MSRVTGLILQMGGKPYDIYRKSVTTDPDSGADIIEYSKTLSALCRIQPASTDGGGKGVVLQNSDAGDSIIADFFMYHETPLKVHDRVQYGGMWCEIRVIEPWQASFMKFYKSSLVKVDNENNRS